MLEFKDYIGLLVLGATTLAAWFNLKSDVRSQAERIERTDKAALASTKAMQDLCSALTERVQDNAQSIRELQMQQVQTDEHRNHTARLLDKLDARMERQDGKMDEMLKAITQVDTKLQERTKELHS